MLAAALASAAAGAAAAQEAPSPEEARALLHEACLADGNAPAQCACLEEFVSESFTDREIVGAAIVFSDPMLAEDPAAALTTLFDAGYEIDEITAVLERIVSLETAAQETCETPEGG